MKTAAPARLLQPSFGHKHSSTAILDQRLREAVGSRNWPLVGEIAKKRTKRDREAG